MRRRGVDDSFQHHELPGRPLQDQVRDESLVKMLSMDDLANKHTTNTQPRGLHITHTTSLNTR
jgi:hypothetical protein